MDTLATLFWGLLVMNRTKSRVLVLGLGLVLILSKKAATALLVRPQSHVRATWHLWSSIPEARQQHTSFNTLLLTQRKINLAPWPYTSSMGPIKRDREDLVAKVLVKRGEYCSGGNLSDVRLSEIIDRCSAPAHYMTIAQALSLRKQLLVSKIISNSWRIKDAMPMVRKQYAAGRSICAIAAEIDQPAMALLRNILTSRAQERYPDMDYRDVKVEVRAALRNEDSTGGGALHGLLTAQDAEQLLEAKKSDQLSFAEENLAERETSLAWETALCAYLDSTQCTYLDEDGVKGLGCKSTPDVVLLDDVYINDKPVRWIDCKVP